MTARFFALNTLEAGPVPCLMAGPPHMRSNRAGTRGLESCGTD